ncbi:MAG: DsbA family protein [Nitrospinota bacterium]
MALRGMARIEKESGVKVRWVPWEGRPEGVPFLERTPEEAERLLAKHSSIASKYDLTLIFPQKKCRTRLAHQATLFARDQGRMGAFRDAVYRARFQEDLGIGDPEVLVSLVEGVGLDGPALRQALDREVYAPELDAMRRQGKSLGVEKIPSYAVDGRIIWGTDPTEEVLEALMKRPMA